MIVIILLCGLVYVILKIKNCSSNHEYDAWLTEDKAKYPKFYEDENDTRNSTMGNR